MSMPLTQLTRGTVMGIEPFQQEVVVLYCRQCTRGHVDLREEDGIRIRPVAVPCSSKIQASHLLQILAEGADAVELVACPEDRCRFLVGSSRAESRVERARQLLEEADVGADRIGFCRGQDQVSDEIILHGRSRAEAARHLGPNPMKIPPI